MIRINLAPPRARPRFGGVRFQMPSPNLGVLFLVVYVAAGAGITIYWAQLYREEQRLVAELDRATREL